MELLLLRLNVPVDRLTDGSTEIGASTDVLTAYRLIHEAGGLVIAAHANTTHGVGMRGVSFGGQTKIAFTQDQYLDALEVTDLDDPGRRSTARFFDGSKPEYPRRMHCIQGSDAHRLTRDLRDKARMGIGDRASEILLPEVSFEALREVLEGDDFSRTRPSRPLAEKPFDHIEAAREQGNTIVQSFHESMSRQGGRLHKVLCDVVAMANTQGGTVYVGLSVAKKGEPRGVENPAENAITLKREIERHITPPLEANVNVVETAGVPVLRITVPRGTEKPYALDQTRIYVREETDSTEAVRDEIVNLVLATHALAPVTSAPPVAVAAPVVIETPVTVAAPVVIETPAVEPVVAEPPVAEPSVPAPVKPRATRSRRAPAVKAPVAAEPELWPEAEAMVAPVAEAEASSLVVPASGRRDRLGGRTQGDEVLCDSRSAQRQHGAERHPVIGAQVVELCDQPGGHETGGPDRRHLERQLRAVAGRQAGAPAAL